MLLAEAFRYLDLLIFLAGTLLYGFLTREFLRRRRVLRRNVPLRLLLACWTLWYAGALIDDLLSMLHGDPAHSGLINTALDLARGFAWLASFPLLAHTLAREYIAFEPDRRRFTSVLPFLAYLPLALFLIRAKAFADQGEHLLNKAADDVYPWILLHVAVSLSATTYFAAGLRRLSRDARLNRFLKLLMFVMATVFAVVFLAGFFRPWEGLGSARVIRTLLLAGLLLPGALFAFFVQRYNLLRLSLSHGTLRHFVGVIFLVLLVMAAGPTVAQKHPEVLRRFVAWGLLLALVGGVAYRPLVEWLLARSSTLRRLLGHHVSPGELDHLMETIQQLDLDEGDALARTADELGLWLGAKTQVLSDEEAGAHFWNAFRESKDAVIHQLDPPDPKIARLLEALQLHAVFALRVEGRLDGVLGLGTSRTGGGYADGEIEAIKLVMRQLSGTLALRRLLGHRLAEERRLAEHERLSLLGLVAASLAHELKNPLSSIKVLAQSLREELAESDPDGEGVIDLGLILEQIERLNLTAHEILGLARPRSGDGTDLGPLLQSSLYILQAEARKRGIEIRSALVDPGLVPGTEAGWQTVIFNLVLNAIEHTPRGEEIDVLLDLDGGDPDGDVQDGGNPDGGDPDGGDPDGGTLRFEVRNPGERIPPDVAQRLFAPFVTDGGTGLGLTLVARRVEELNGTIEVDHADGKVIFRVLTPSHEEDSERDAGTDETISEDESVGEEP